MSACPNINSKEWKNLVAKIGVFDAMKEFIKNNEQIPNSDNYQETFKGVNATMKVVTGLQKIPNTLFNAKIKDNFFNNLIKQGVPKNQLELLKDYIEKNNITDITTNNLIVGLLSEMSYTVEINVSKDVRANDFSFRSGYENFIYGKDTYNLINVLDKDLIPIPNEFIYYKNRKQVSKEEYEDAYENAVLTDQHPTQYYVEMTVPGGMNYRENEFAVPDIVPFMKGHAQFSTENGIGWFRSDDLDNKSLNTKVSGYSPATTDWGIQSQIPNKHIVWHGSDEDIKKFESEFPQGYFNTVKNGAVNAIFFSKDKAPKGTVYGNRKYQKQFIVQIDNPLIVDTEAGYSRDNESFKELVDRAIKNGNDGIIIKNVHDNFNTDIYISLDSEKVKPLSTNKTRRILEVQSDLFQKGRDKEFLVDNYKHTPGDRNFNVIYEGKEYKVGTMGGMQKVVIYKTLEGQVHYENPKQDWLTQEEIPQGLKDIVSNKFNNLKQEVLTQNKSNQENQFLQLLNKDNNWVTFFVKSIIQDSAKKGYEKVLFPTGNTASKVEGHTTLEEFKKQKEDRLKQLKKEHKFLAEAKIVEHKSGTFAVKVEQDSPHIQDLYGATYNRKMDLEDDLKKYLKKRVNEIIQLKQELERVEKEGFAALRPIYNFYENTVANVLKKQGYNPRLIKDEYNNEWYEVNLLPDFSKESISFNKQENTTTFGKQLLKYLQDKDIVASKEFPAGSGNFYIKKTTIGQDRNLYTPEETERKNIEKINNINQKLGFNAITYTKVGNGLVIKINEQLSLFDRFDEDLLFEDISPTEGDKSYLNDNLLTENTYQLLDNTFRIALMLNKDDIINVASLILKNRNLLSRVTVRIYNDEEWKLRVGKDVADLSHAFYDASNNQIGISRSSFESNDLETNIRIVLEEFLHAVTVQPFYKFQMGLDLTDKEAEFIHHINRLYGEYSVKASSMANNAYRFLNEREFIIGLTLDDRFKKYLNELDEVEAGFFRTLINKIVDAILRLFGIKTEKRYPFEKLTMSYINNYLSDVSEIKSLYEYVDEWNKDNEKYFSKDFTSFAKDIRTEKEELKESLTDTQKENIKNKIKDFLNQIKSISGTSRFSNPEIKNAVFHIYKDYDKFNESDIDMIDFFFNFVREINSIFNSLDRQIKDMDNSRVPLTDREKLSKWNRIISTARDFDSTLNELDKIKNQLFDEDLIAKEIDKILIKRNNIEKKYFLSITPMVTNQLSTIIEPANKKALDYLDSEIKQLESRIVLATKNKAKQRVEYLNKELEKKKKERDEKYNIDAEKVQNYLRGIFGDSSTLSVFLEASIVSGNPIVSAITKYIKDGLHKSDSNILSMSNEMETEISLYEKKSGLSRNNLEEFNRPLLDTYDVVESIDDDYNFAYKKKLALLSPWNMDYIKEIQKFSYINGKIKEKIKNAKSESEIKELKEKQKENTKNRVQFIKDYMEMPYLKEVHDAMELIHEDLGGYTAYEAIGELYDEKDNLEEDIERTKDQDIKDILYNKLDEIEFRIKEIRSTYEKDPNSREYKIAMQLRKRDEAMKKYRKFVLTSSGKAKFKLEKERIDKEYENGEITKKERDFWYQHNTVNALTEDYWTEKLGIISQMNDLLNQMNVERKEKDENITNLYNEIENIVKPYRDHNGIINGNSFNQKQIADIKDLEEKIEKFKDSATNIFGLSRLERVELANLNERLQNNDIESQSETDPERLEFLRNEQITIELRIEELQGKKKTFNKKLISKYFDLMKKLNNLDDVLNTHYFEERYEQEFEKYAENQTTVGIGDKFTNDGITYEKINSQWYAKVKDKSQKITKKEAEKVFKIKKAKITFSESEWYKNNHIKKLKWIPSGKTFDPFDPYASSGYWEEQLEPIYVWRYSDPKNPKHKISGQPSLKYKRSFIKNGKNDDGIPDGSPNYTNPNYKLTINGYNVPRLIGAKDDRFVNKKYVELSTSKDEKDKARFRYLNYQTNLYFNSQVESFIPKTMRPGYDMPSIRPSKIERFQATSVSDKISEVGQWVRGITDETVNNEQDKDILYGYLDNKGMIPMKFIGEIDVEDQSIDIARSIGMFYIAAQQRARLAETYSLVSSTADILAQKENTPTKVVKGKVATVAKKYLSKNTTVARHISGTSNTLRQVNEIINTFYFGETIKDERGAKKLNTVLSVGSKLMLGLNFASMIQNWSNAKIQSILEGESKLTKNFTTKNFIKAEAIYWTHINELMADLSKYGNKSYINQFIDYFGGINFNIINSFDTSSAHKAFLQSSGKLLMPTEMAEHQLSYALFISIALSTNVKMNGEDINLFDAFRIGENGIELKDGVELSQEQKDEFINKINSSARRINGEYGNLDSPIAQKFVLGRLFLFMNKYFVPFFMRRFGKRRFNIQDGIQDDGFWRLYFRTLWSDITKFQLNIVQNWKYYTDSEKAAIKQVSTEISVSLVIMSMIALLGGDDDKELKDNTQVANNIIYVLKGIKRQNEQFMLVPGLGLDDVYNRIKNPIPIATKLGQAFSVLNDAVYLAGYSMGWNELKDIQYTKKSGWHNKGDLKIMSDIGRLLSLPYKYNQIMHPDIAIKNLNAYRIK